MVLLVCMCMTAMIVVVNNVGKVLELVFNSDLETVAN